MDCKLLWKKAKTFKEAQKLIIDFLEGECRETPWHFDTIDEETIPLVESLININKKGFITLSGQPGTCLGKTDIKTGEKYTEEQRGYIEGFIKNEKVKKFIDNLEKTGKVIVYAERLDAIYLSEIKIEAENRIPLTVEIDETSKTDYTNFNYDIPGREQLNIIPNKKLKNHIRNTCTYMTIITREFCNENLTDIVEKCLS